MQLLIDGEFDKMVAFHPPAVVGVPLESIVGRTKNVPLDSDVLATARAVGVSFGDEVTVGR